MATLNQHQPISDSQPQTTSGTGTEGTAASAVVTANVLAGDSLTAAPVMSLSGRHQGPPPAKVSVKYKPETTSLQ